MFKCLFAAVIIACGLVGCAAPGYIPLSEENAKKIQTVDVRSMVIQDEVIARSDPSNISAALGGGLIPALIDASVTASRQDKLQSAMDHFYESVEDYDFRAIFWPQLTTQLQEHYPFKVKTIVTTPRGIGYRDEKKYASTLEDNQAEIIMATSYFLSPDLRTLNVSTRVNLWMKGGDKPAYKNVMTYQSSVLGEGDERSAKAWAKDGGKPFMEKLNEGIRETLAMLSIDMQNNTAVSATEKKITAKYNLGDARPTNKSNVKGTVMETRGDRVILRTDAGLLYSVQP